MRAGPGMPPHVTHPGPEQGAPGARAPALALGRDDGQQDVRRSPGPRMERDRLREDLGRPVPRVVVLEGTDAREDRAEGPEARAGTARVLVIAPAHGERDPE